jgi:hypothetical protein
MPDDFIVANGARTVSYQIDSAALVALQQQVGAGYGPGGSAGNIGTAQGDARYAQVFRLDPAHASTDASPVDATAYIQSVLDACAAGDGSRHTVVIPDDCTFFFTLLEVGDGTTLTGFGQGSVLKQMPGITYNSGGNPTGSYGLTTKTAVKYVAFTNFTIDGNASTCTDAAANFSSAFVGGVYTPGQLKCGGLAIDRLNRGNLTDGTWVSPDYVYVDKVWSVNGVRSPFLFQMDTNRTTPGIADIGYIYARDSAVDHLLYAAESESIQIQNFVGEGHWNQGAFAISGAKFAGGSVFFRNLTANPWNNTTYGYQFASSYCIDDRPDVKGSTFDSVSLVGDLALLGGTDPERCLFRARGFGTTASNVQVEHTGTNLDLEFRIMTAEVGSTPGGTIEGPSISGLKARGMPSKTRIFSFDPNAWGANLIGGSISDVYMTTAVGAAPQPTALFEFKGVTANGFRARNVYVENEGYATGGPSAIYENDCTSTFADIEFEGVVIRRGSSSNAAWINLNASSPSNVALINCKCYSAASSSRAATDAVERILNCTFGAAKIVDNTLEVIRKTADQSITSSTTLTNDSALFTWLRANAVYVVETSLIVDADVTGAIKTGISAPTGSTVQRATAAPTGPFATGTTVDVRRFATISTSSTAGFVQFQWAQNASSATATVVKAGSFIKVRRIS